MIEHQRESPKSQLTVERAQGTSAAKWARINEVTERTAYRWAAEPLIRSEIESSRRRRALDEAIGRLAKRASWAVDGIVELCGNAASESVWSSVCKLANM
jgi:hypothetical protein